MLKRALLCLWALLLLGLLAACGSASAPAAATAPAGSAAAAQPGAARSGAEVNGIPESTTPEGYHVLGRPDAPVTLVMYSDFL